MTDIVDSQGYAFPTSGEIIFAIGIRYRFDSWNEDSDANINIINGEEERDMCILRMGKESTNALASDAECHFLEYSGIEMAAKNLETGVYKATFDIRNNENGEPIYYNIQFDLLFLLKASSTASEIKDDRNQSR